MKKFFVIGIIILASFIHLFEDSISHIDYIHSLHSELANKHSLDDSAEVLEPFENEETSNYISFIQNDGIIQDAIDSIWKPPVNS